MKANYKQKCFYTAQDIDRAIKKELDATLDKVYQDVKQDVAAQIISICLTELNKEFGFGKNRLQQFYKGVNGLLRIMSTDGIFGKEFTPVNCIEYMREQFGIDVDKKG